MGNKWQWFFGFATLASFIFGLWEYISNQQTKAIAYAVEEQSVKIYDNENATPAIRLLEKDTIPIKENVYLITGKIWNKGQLAINTIDQRGPLTIEIKGCRKMLDFRISRQNKENISGFVLAKISEQKLDVHWKYFDPGYGFEFQIIYLGQIKPEFRLNGDFSPPFSGVSTYPGRNYFLRFILASIITGLLGGIAGFAGVDLFFTIKMSKSHKLVKLGLGILLLVFFAFVIFAARYLADLLFIPVTPF